MFTPAARADSTGPRQFGRPEVCVSTRRAVTSRHRGSATACNAARSMSSGSSRSSTPSDASRRPWRATTGLDNEAASQTVWEAASLSKPVVARHVLRLASEGVLDLDEPLDIDLAALHAVADPRWREVTARRVLTHTSGLPNWRGPVESARAAGVNIPVNPEMLAFARAPGSFCYSGEGFEVILHALT